MIYSNETAIEFPLCALSAEWAGRHSLNQVLTFRVNGTASGRQGQTVALTFDTCPAGSPLGVWDIGQALMVRGQDKGDQQSDRQKPDSASLIETHYWCTLEIWVF